jgi:hypothetical protein
VKIILRPHDAAKAVGLPFSSFNEARKQDPDFVHCRAIVLGLRAIGFDSDEVLKVVLRKAARRDGFTDDHLDEEVERRFIEEKARELLIEEARQRLAHKPRNKAVKLVAAE